MSQDNRIVVHGINPSLKVQDKSQVFNYDENNPITRLELSNRFIPLEGVNSINSLALQNSNETGYKIYTLQDKEVDTTVTPNSILYKTTLHISTYKPQLNEDTNLVEEVDTNLVELNSSSLKVNTTLDMANNSIVNVPEPINDTDAANKAYVDNNAGAKADTGSCALEMLTFGQSPTQYYLHVPEKGELWQIFTHGFFSFHPAESHSFFFCGHMLSVEEPSRTLNPYIYSGADEVWGTEQETLYRFYPFVCNGYPAILAITGDSQEDYHAYISTSYPINSTRPFTLPEDWFSTISTAEGSKVFSTPVGSYLPITNSSYYYVVKINITDLDNANSSDVSIIGPFSVAIDRILYRGETEVYFINHSTPAIYLNESDNQIPGLFTYVDKQGYRYTKLGEKYLPNNDLWYTIASPGSSSALGTSSRPIYCFDGLDDGHIIIVAPNRYAMFYNLDNSPTSMFQPMFMVAYNSAYAFTYIYHFYYNDVFYYIGGTNTTNARFFKVTRVNSE